MGEEIATDTNEKPDMTKFGKFCQQRGINSNLIMLKITLFVMYGATSSLLPYLTIHMQSIGLTVEEIAIIYLALPFTTFLSPPITGFLVDKFGKYKPVVVMSLLLNALFHHSLLFIPQQEIPGVMPSAYVMRHPENGAVEVWWSSCPSRECPEENDRLTIVVDQCIDHCLLMESNPIITSMDYTLSPFNLNKAIPQDDENITNTSNRSMLNDVLISATDFPITNGTLLNQRNFNESTYENWILANINDSAYFSLLIHNNLALPTQNLGMEIQQENVSVTNFKQRFGEKFLEESGVNITALEKDDIRCGGLVLETNMSDQYDWKLERSTVACMVQKCRFQENGPDICPPDYKETDDRIFWLYFLLRFLATTMLSAGVTIMDPIALTMIEKYGGDFGRERLFSSIGMAIFSPITGLLIDYSSRGLNYTDYSAAFYTYDILLIISTISVILMPLGEKLPADNVFRDLFNLLKMPHVMIFILFLFVLGNFWGFIESFLFLYLKELGAPNYLLGITITVGTVSSIPFLYGAEKITRIFGHVNLIIIAFFSHAGRLVGYSFIENAWWCFPFEAMEALSCHLMWVAAATYCSILAPKNLLATLIGVLGMAHFSLGRGSGSFCGGLLIGSVGTRDAFSYMGLLAVFGGIAYGVLHLVWLRKFDHQLDDLDEEAYENGETDKLTEPATKDQGTGMSQERLSLMIKYNQIGSLTSLPRGSRADIHDHLTHRRSSYNIESVKVAKVGGTGSASKVDLLKSALEINHKTSNNSRADSAPKLSLNNTKNISQPTLEGVVLEVSMGVESTFYPPMKMRKYPSGLLMTTPVVEFSAIPNSILSDDERKESIPEEAEPATNNTTTTDLKKTDEKVNNTSSIDGLQTPTKDGT